MMPAEEPPATSIACLMEAARYARKLGDQTEFEVGFSIDHKNVNPTTTVPGAYHNAGTGEVRLQCFRLYAARIQELVDRAGHLDFVARAEASKMTHPQEVSP